MFELNDPPLDPSYLITDEPLESLPQGYEPSEPWPDPPWWHLPLFIVLFPITIPLTLCYIWIQWECLYDLHWTDSPPPLRTLLYRVRDWIRK